jgi:hypothetical protein
MTGKVVVNRAMSLDDFVAAPGDSMDWVSDYASPHQVPVDRVNLQPVSSTTSGAVTEMRFRAVDRCAG